MGKSYQIGIYIKNESCQLHENIYKVLKILMPSANQMNCTFSLSLVSILGFVKR